MVTNDDILDDDFFPDADNIFTDMTNGAYASFVVVLYVILSS